MQENQPQAPTANSLQTTVTVDNRPKANSFLVLLLSILLLMSCIIAGFFAFQTQQLVNELRVTRDELKQTPTPIASTEPTPDPVANWKTYTNDKYKFSFRYPEQLDKKQDVKYPEILSLFKEESTMFGEKTIKFKPWAIYGSLPNFNSLEDSLKFFTK